MKSKKETISDKVLRYWTKINQILGKSLLYWPILMILGVILFVGWKFKGTIYQKLTNEPKEGVHKELSRENLESKGKYSSVPTEFREWIDELKKEMKPESKKKLLEMKESDLFKLHRGYGMYIRNKWLWGSRNPELSGYFLSKGINHPDTMSMELIKYLWHDIQKEERKK